MNTRTTRRVVITGGGCVSPIGKSLPELFGNLQAGVSGVARATLFDGDAFPVRVAAEVKNWSSTDYSDISSDWPRQTQFAAAAAEQAAEMAGFDANGEDPTRTGVQLGCGEIFSDLRAITQLIAAAHCNQQFCESRYYELLREQPTRWEHYYEPANAAAVVAARWDAQGPCSNITNACVSGAQAIGLAAETIRRGEADRMIAGGAHSLVSDFGVSGFLRLSTLATGDQDNPHQLMKPFDRNRNGFVIGEGAGMIVLEELEHARKRGANILAELSGFGATQDAFRLTDPHPVALGAARSISLALEDAGIHPKDVDHINAHGTGTVANDRTETLAIKTVFGSRAYEIPLSSNKSMVGHLTTASGALEILSCIMSLREGVIPPTINLETPDPACDLDYTPQQSRERKCRHVLSNSFGFGGQNVVLALSRFDM